MDSAGSDRPQRRTALVGKELDKYKAAITEEWLLEEDGADYTYFWSRSKN